MQILRNPPLDFLYSMVVASSMESAYMDFGLPALSLGSEFSSASGAPVV